MCCETEKCNQMSGDCESGQATVLWEAESMFVVYNMYWEMESVD